MPHRLDWVKDNYPTLNPTITHLDVGDYHYILKDGREVVFEYKTGADFLKSIRDGHLHNQVYDLATNFDWHFIMVCVGSWNQLFKELYYRAGVEYDMGDVMGAIASFNRFTTVIVMHNRRECFDMMLKQAQKIEKNKLLAPRHPRKDVNPAVNYLLGLHRMGDETVESIVTQFDVSSLQDLLDLTQEDLISINGIGKKRANTIMHGIRGGR